MSSEVTLENLGADSFRLLFLPPYTLAKISAWYGHVPFAHWLVGAIKPSIIVELGTHNGISYAALCQSVLERNLQTKCYAVDTWRGDDHAGRYDESIYEDLKAFNSQKYRNFSSLLRMTFDEALDQFADSSIDLLHIDGFHSYEAVSHDFQSWKRKLSDRAVVLFHDTAEHREGFGVWRFWEEISKEFPSFAFEHSHGLGVLAVGNQAPAEVLRLCELSATDTAKELRHRFQVIGSRWSVEADAIRRDEQQAKKNAAMEERRKVAEKRVAESAKRCEALQAKLDSVAVRARQDELQLQRLNGKIRALLEEQNCQNHHLERLEAENNQILGSTSWRLTAPLRTLINRVPNGLRQSAIQLFKRFRRTYSHIKLIQNRKLYGHYKFIQNSNYFDERWYCNNYADIDPIATDPLLHYINHGSRDLRNPGPRFDAVFYIENNYDAVGIQPDALSHYLTIGKAEGRVATVHDLLERSPFFDAAYYVNQLSDPAQKSLDPVDHYIKIGVNEGLDPSVRFSTKYYLDNNPDVQRAGINPLHHYLVVGSSEGRKPVPFDFPSSEAWIREIKLDSAVGRVQEKSPLVSIIMPTKNRARMIIKAIDSVIAQTYKHWELIIVDDHSVDSTVAMIHSRYPDARIQIQQNDGAGVCAARNSGLSASSGSVIAYLDSDNAWTPEYLEYMLYEMERSGASSVYSALRRIHHSDVPDSYLDSPFNYDQLKLYNFIDLNVFIHQMSLVHEHGAFDETLKRMVDWDLILRYTKNSEPSYANFVGVDYDAGPSPSRITNVESRSYLNVVRNKHLIDWREVTRTIDERNSQLVSIIMCVYGNIEMTEICLQSLFTHQAGEQFELIIVNNDQYAINVERLKQWEQSHSEIKLIENPENFNFALGNNIGFSHSTGDRVVFLNNDTEVSPEWLRALVRPLTDASIKGTQAKLLYPDGSIQGAGLVFSKGSPIAYPIYADMPGDFAPTQRSRNYRALTAACIAFRARDFAVARGFDPIYVNGQEDVDLCLRIGAGEPVFQYVADSIVMHHESKSWGRGLRTEENRQHFLSRWKGKTPHDDESYYIIDGMSVNSYSVKEPAWEAKGYAVHVPNFDDVAIDRYPEKHSEFADFTIAIKIGCPRSELKDHWGDYHFAVALAVAFRRKGIKARIDFLADWQSAYQPGDINFVLRGLSRFQPRMDSVNVIWVISHPESVTAEELREFDCVFAASSNWSEFTSPSIGFRVESLLQCTDACRFYPHAENPNYQNENLFVANSRRVFRDVVQRAVKEKLPLAIYGEMWEDLAPAEWIKGEKIENVDLPNYYSNANVVLNDHWGGMRDAGFISNRIFDALACATPVVTDTVAGIPEELLPGCYFYDQEETLRTAVARASSDRAQKSTGFHDIADVVQKRHSFDVRVDQMLPIILKLIHPSRKH